MKSVVMACAALSLLSGCVTAEQRIAQDDMQCLSYGVPKGSPAYVECRMRLDQNRSTKQAAASFGNSGGLVGFIERQSQQ